MTIISSPLLDLLFILRLDRHALLFGVRRRVQVETSITGNVKVETSGGGDIHTGA